MPLTTYLGAAPKLSLMAADGGLTTNFIGDYSVTPVTARFTAPYDLLIPHFSVVVKDVNKLNAAGFGSGAALANGFEFAVELEDGTLIGDALPGNVIRRNSDFLRWAEDVLVIDWGEPASQEVGFTAHYEPAAAWGAPFPLKQDQSIVAVLSDDFTGLTELSFAIIGFKLHPVRRRF